MKIVALLAFTLAKMAAAKGFGPPKTPNDARGRYVSKLLGGAKEVTPNSKLGRRLENGNGYNVDISSYSIKFQRCQFVKSYDDELAADEETPTVLATKRFIVFRLCPNNNCQSCNYNYGEYLVDLETYLGATIDYQKESQQEKCYACQNYCGDDDDANNAQRGLENYQNDIDCDACYEECVKIENMEEMGFIDATTFIECQVLYDPDDDGKTTYYAGPMCSGSGYKIKIGVFTDQYCSVLDSTKDVDDYLMNEDGTQSKLSHALLKTVYSDGSCVACTGGNDDDDGGAYEMCGALYQESAKCETTHGFENGYANYNGYDTQLQQEEIVCDFIDSIKAGSYDEYGEIVVNDLANSGTMTTSGQKFALTLFVLLTAGLAVYAGTLHRRLTRGPAPGLSDQGTGLMA
eukprot:scaffold880_cov132-Cylindrotheca_fusiformis.AAC.46